MDFGIFIDVMLALWAGGATLYGLHRKPWRGDRDMVEPAKDATLNMQHAHWTGIGAKAKDRRNAVMDEMRARN